MMTIIGNNRLDLIYASFTNDTIAKPFAVFVDFNNKQIIIAVRGTLSLEDCITDVLAEPEEVTNPIQSTYQRFCKTKSYYLSMTNNFAVNRFVINLSTKTSKYKILIMKITK